MNLEAIAGSVDRIREDEQVRSQVARGEFEALGIPALSREEQEALQALAQRVERGEGLPAHLLRSGPVPLLPWF